MCIKTAAKESFAQRRLFIDILDITSSDPQAPGPAGKQTAERGDHIP